MAAVVVEKSYDMVFDKASMGYDRYFGFSLCEK